MNSQLNQITKRLDEIDAAIALKPVTVESLTAALRMACQYIDDNHNDPAAQKSIKEIADKLKLGV